MTGEGMDSFIDVVILGGGPCGIAAGLTLLKRKGVSVTVIEKSAYEIPRIGESLSPGIRPLLEYLEVWEDFQKQNIQEAFGSSAAWGDSRASNLDFMFTVHGNGWALDRVGFDRMLAKTFENRGGTLLTQTRFLSAEKQPKNGWKIWTSDDKGSRNSLHARYVIDATGRAGRFSRARGVSRKFYDQLIGVAQTAQLPVGETIESSVLVEACEYGWWYSAPIPGHRLSVVLMSDADIVRKMKAARPLQWHSLLDQMPLTRERLGGAAFQGTPKPFSSCSSCLDQIGGKDWVAVGDAAASHDPLSSSGIPHAVGSGVHGALVAANALYSDGAMLKEFGTSVQKDYQRYLQTHWQYYSRETRWPESLFWERRTTPIALDPTSRIEKKEEPKGRRAFEPIHLPPQDLKTLRDRCHPGRSAAEVVKEMAVASPELPDQRIILGFQELVDSGELTMT